MTSIPDFNTQHRRANGCWLNPWRAGPPGSPGLLFPKNDQHTSNQLRPQFMRQHQRTNTETALASKTRCINERTLEELAAGIAPPGAMEEHAEHIVNCDRCALLLKTYISEFSDEVTPEEETILCELESSKPVGQKRILQKILSQMTPNKSE